MQFEDFQQLARMYVIGTLDPEELHRYENGREMFGPAADHYVEECRRLGAVLALSLSPSRARDGSKQRLLEAIRNGARRDSASTDRRTRLGKDRPLHEASEREMSE